jgi:hypothetical protein
MKASICRFSVLALAIHTTLALADPPSTSAYHTDKQDSYVEDATSKGVQQVNFITCLMSAMRPDAMVNEGNYSALVDGSKCQNDATATADGTTSFNTAYLNVTRATNNDPMISRIWLEEEDEGQQSTIFVRVSATEAPSANNAYGKFRLDYCGTAEGMIGCRNNGYLEGSDAGMRYFENEQGDHGTSVKAVQLNASGTTSGTGTMSIDGGGNQSAAFNFAYNASLFRRKDLNGDDQCFSRDASDPGTGMSVWRYGLYDATTGARVERQSGFQIEFVNSGTTYRGYLGYGGLSLPSEGLNALTSGSTVQKVDYDQGDAPTRTDYTVVKAGGKLSKYTRHTRSLHGIDKVKFSVFVGNNGTALFAGAHANTSYEIYWSEEAHSFMASSEMNCSMNGCNNSVVSPEMPVSVSFWASQSGIQGFSNTLGGEVFVALEGHTTINSDDVNVVYRVQDLVYPSDMPATLHCLRDCPTAASLSAFFALDQQSQQGQSPYVNASSQGSFTPVTSSVNYTTDKSAAMLKDSTSADVVFAQRDALEHSNFSNGLRSGKLYADSLEATECSPGSGTYCDDKINAMAVYYQWETGVNSFNQFAAVKDSTGEYLKFDAPLQVNYSVPAESKYGEYAGQSIVLQYGGFGELYGIPGYCVSAATNAVVGCENGGDNEDIRYVPSFTIPFNTTQGKVTVGDATYFVKWLNREIRFANKASSVCDAAGLVTPTGVTLPTAAELQNPSDPSSAIYIGTKPVVTAAPRVIHGEVKY